MRKRIAAWPDGVAFRMIANRIPFSSVPKRTPGSAERSLSVCGQGADGLSARADNPDITVAPSAITIRNRGKLGDLMGLKHSVLLVGMGVMWATLSDRLHLTSTYIFPDRRFAINHRRTHVHYLRQPRYDGG